MSRMTGNKTLIGRGFALLVLLIMLLTVSTSAKASVNAGNSAAAKNDSPAAPATVYYKYPFQNPALTDQVRVADLISRMTLDEKVSLLHQFSGAIIRLGVPQFRTGTEGLHGLSWLGPATVFPQGQGLSMSWDQSLINAIGGVVGSEARAYNSVDARFNGVDIWAPVIDLARDPRSGRMSENMGEDALLAGLMSTSYAWGMKGTDPFYYESIPTLKHFGGYGQEANRTGVSDNISPRNLYEYYFKAFEYGIQSGAATGIMTSYNLVNGKPTMVMPEMLDVMFGQWVPGGLSSGAFFNVTDAGSPSNLSGSNAYYPNSVIGQAASMADSIKSGVSAMTPGDTDTPTTRRWIYEAIARGMLSETDINNVIHGMLLVRLHAGDLDADPINPYKDLNKQNALNTPANAAVALQAAHEQVVLLKNDGGILPLSKSLANVALIGPLADENSTDFYAGTYPYATYIEDKVQSKLTGGAGAISFTRGLNIVALQVVTGTGTPNGKYLIAGSTAGSALTGSGTTTSDPKAQFYHYDYGYNNMLFRSVAFDQPGPGCGCYVAARGSGSTLVTNANPPGWESNNRASQQWTTDQNFGFVSQVGNVAALQFPNGTGLPSSTNSNVFVNTASPYNVQYNGSNSSSNRQFSIVTVKDGIADAVAKATGAAVAIVAVGDEPHLTSRETQDRLTNSYGILLPPYQQSLINAVAAVNPNTIVVIVGSYPFDVRDIQANANVKAIVYTSHAGQELGSAVADVLFGDYAPAGRLNQTWYPGLDTLPAISDYDIIKGQRTYQYYTGTPIYPFGYGLSYSTFGYSSLAVNPTTASNATDPNITVNLTVTNTGAVASDEVVELYAKYNDGATSKVQHPLKKLSGFERIHLAVGETKPVSFTVKLSDLAIWDVSRNEFFVEPGSYTFQASRSSADAAIQSTANITVTGPAIPPRDFSLVTNATDWDDYSFTTATAGGVQADVIPISAMEDNTYSIQARAAGSWVKYANVDISGTPAGVIVRASNPNGAAANIQVWQTSPSAAANNAKGVSGKGQSVTAGGTLLGTVAVPPTGNVQTFVNVGATLSGFSGSTGDIYLVFPTANVGLKWLKLGAITPASSADIQVNSNLYNSSAATSISRLHIKMPAVITQKSGVLLMEAIITGTGVVTSPVAWSVADTSGNPTALATINSTSGQLTAAGTANGFIRAVASYTTTTGIISNYLTVELRNQTVTANTNPDAVVIRSGFDSRPADISWGPNQFTNFGAIYQYKGTIVLSAVTYPGVSPARVVTFTLASDTSGTPTTLATVASAAAGFVQGQTSGATNTAYNGTIQATGVGDGDVYVTATTANGLTFTTKIVIQNQTTRNAFTPRYEAELFDASGNISTTTNLRADDVHGDDVGLQLNRIRNNDYAVYNNFDFGGAKSLDMTIKYVKVSTETSTIKIMVDSPITGTVLGVFTPTGTYNIATGDYANVVYHWQQATVHLTGAPSVPGVHNLYLVFAVSANVPNTDISSTYGAVAGWLDLGINWFNFAVVKVDQTIDFPAIADQTLGAADFDPGATASSGLPVTYGATGTCSIVANKVHLTGVGSCTVTASQAGDSFNNPAPDVSRTFTINEAVSWIDLVNVSASGNTITKTSANSAWDAGGASSKQIASGDGYGQITVADTTRYLMFGLSHNHASVNYPDLSYAIYTYANTGELAIYENGTYRAGFAGYNPGDVLRVAVESGVVNYYRNGNLLYTSTVAPTYPLQVAGDIFTPGGQVSNALIYGTNLSAAVAWTPTATPSPTRTSVALTPTAINWIDLANVVAGGSTITKTGSIAAWDAGAAADKQLVSGDGYAQMTINDTSRYLMFGLATSHTGNAYAEINYAVYTYANAGDLAVYENGAYKGSFPGYSAGDTIRVAVVGGIVKYSRNGSVFYSSTVAPSYPLLAVGDIFTPGGQVNNGTIAGNLGSVTPWTPTAVPTATQTPLPLSCNAVTFANLTNVSASGNSITKSIGSSAWNAGATSSQSIASGNGSVEETITNTVSYTMFGLGSGNNNGNYTGINYAIYTYANTGQLAVYESGTYRGNFDSYTTGDVIKVSVSGGVVSYAKNGITFYTSTVAPSYPLLLNAAIFTPGGMVSNAQICGSNLTPVADARPDANGGRPNGAKLPTLPATPAAAPADPALPASAPRHEAVPAAPAVPSGSHNVPALPIVPARAGFLDVPSNFWAAQYIDWAVSHISLSGYDVAGGREFRPNQTATRGQVVKLLVSAAGWQLASGGQHFSDVPANSAFYKWIETAAAHNVVSGYADGTFRPNATLTRAQMVKIVVLAAGWQLAQAGSVTFSDVPASNWAAAYVATAASRNVVSGYADGTFRPEASLTRAQMVKLLFNGFAQ